MELYLDTASLEEIKEAANWGVISGVTTNPSLIAKEGVDFKDRINQITKFVSGPISAEVIAEDTRGMVEEARDLSKIAPNIVVKIPLTREGLKATKILAEDNINTNLTLAFSLNQALLAARAGASYVSPFLGRLDDIGHDGIELVSDIVETFEHYSINTKVIAASIRHPRHVVLAQKARSHIATVPFQVLEKMLQHPLTGIGIEKFLSDWKKAKKPRA